MLDALIAGGLSLVSGLGARSAAKSAQKRQAANDMIANTINKARIDEKNAINKNLGKRLLKEKEVTTEKGTVTTEHSESSTIASAQDNYSYVDVEGMMDAAERAGFNPVTWLNAGGMQAYTQTGSRGLTTSQVDTKDTVTTDMTTTRKGHNAAAAYALMSPESALVTASQATNIPSVAEAVGNAGKAAFDVYRQDQSKQQSQDFQKELLGIQIKAIQDAKASGSPAVNSGASNGTPSYSTSGGTKTAGGVASVSGGLSTGVNSPTLGYDIQKAEQVNPFPQSWFKVNPRMPGASTIEDYGGDVAGSLYAVPKIIDDLTYTATGGTGFFDMQAYGAKKTFQKVKDLTDFTLNYQPDVTPPAGGVRIRIDPNYVPYNKRFNHSVDLPYGP